MAVFKRHNAGLISGIRGEKRFFFNRDYQSFLMNSYIAKQLENPVLHTKGKVNERTFRIFEWHILLVFNLYLCLDLVNPDVNMTLQGTVFCV